MMNARNGGLRWLDQYMRLYMTPPDIDQIRVEIPVNMMDNFNSSGWLLSTKGRYIRNL